MSDSITETRGDTAPALCTEAHGNGIPLSDHLFPPRRAGRPSDVPRGDFWSSLLPVEQEALRACARPRVYPARSALCHQGDRSDHLVIIEDGWAKVTRVREDGNQVVLAVRGPGDLVCESAVLAQRDRFATVAALSTLRGLVVPAARFTAFLDGHSRVWRLVSEVIVHRLDDSDRRAEAQASATGAQRLALLLVQLAEVSLPYAGPGSDGIPIRPPLSQDELGSWVGASRETVARALHEWRDDGLVRTGWRRITVVDRDGLLAYAASGG